VAFAQLLFYESYMKVFYRKEEELFLTSRFTVRLRGGLELVGVLL